MRPACSLVNDERPAIANRFVTPELEQRCATVRSDYCRLPAARIGNTDTFKLCNVLVELGSD